MKLPAKKWILLLSLLALPAFAAKDDDEDDDNGYQPDLGDVQDGVDVIDHLTHSEHPGAAHAVTPEAHGGMSWEELKRVHDQAKASGSSVRFTDPIGKAPTPFEVDPALRFHPGEGHLGRDAVIAGEATNFGRGGARFAQGAEALEVGGGLRTGVTVVEDVGLARGTFTAARVAEEGLLLKVGAGALGLGGLAASRRRRND